jgi:hypothetical protein
VRPSSPKQHRHGHGHDLSTTVVIPSTGATAKVQRRGETRHCARFVH